MKRNCPGESNGIDEDAVFAIGKNRFDEWLIDSGATSHMTPYREDLFGSDDTILGINVTIANGNKLRVLGKGIVKLAGMDGKHIRTLDIMYVTGLDRRLLSVGNLVERGLRVEFQHDFMCYLGQE